MVETEDIQFRVKEIFASQGLFSLLETEPTDVLTDMTNKLNNFSVSGDYADFKEAILFYVGKKADKRAQRILTGELKEKAIKKFPHPIQAYQRLLEVFNKYEAEQKLLTKYNLDKKIEEVRKNRLKQDIQILKEDDENDN